MKLRTALAIAGAFAAGNLILWSFNYTTRFHAVGRSGQLLGIAAMLAAIAAVGGAVRYGTRDRLVRIIALVAAVLIAGAFLHWVPMVVPVAWISAAGVLAFALLQPGGGKWLAVIGATFGASAIAFLGVCAAGVVIRCDPKHRWLCNLEGLALFALFAAAICGAFFRSRRMILGGQD